MTRVSPIPRWLPAALLLMALGRARAAEEPPILRVDPGGHTAAVHAVLFAPDNRHLLSSGLDKVARVWDRRTGEQYALRYQIGPGVEGQSFAAALDGSGRSAQVALGSSGADPRRDADIFLFDYRTRQQTGRLRGHKGTVTGLAFSPDGEQLASCGTDGTVRLWDPAAGRQERLWKVGEDGRPDYVSGIAFSPDGGRLAAASWHPAGEGGFAGTVSVRDTRTGREIRTFRWGREALCVAWSSLGTLAWGASDGVIHLWDPRTDAEPRRLAALPDTVSCLAFTPDGKQLLSGGGTNGRDTAVRVWSPEEGQELPPSFRGHGAAVFAAAASPDGRAAASGDALGAIYLWEPATGRTLRSLTGSGASAFTLAWSPDGTRVAWGTRFGNETLDTAFDLARVLPEPTRPDPALAWLRAQTRHERLRLALTPDAVILRGDEDREIVRIKARPGDRFWCCGFTPRGEVVVGSEQRLALYGPGRWNEPKREFTGQEGAILALAVSPDGRRLASASADRTLRIWDLEGGAEPRLSLFYGDDLAWVAWTPEGYYAASAVGDDLIGWHINRGFDRAAEYRLSFQVRERFYRPDLVRQALGPAGIPAGGPTQREQIARTPAVEIVEVEGARPDSDERGRFWRVGTPEATVWVRPTAPARGDVTFDLRVNRSPKFFFPFGSKDITGRPGQWPLRARLVEGMNVVRVVAVNAAGESRPVLARLRYDAPKEAIKPATLHVLAVGVRDYADPEIQPLRFADRDAEEIAAAFQAQQGRLFDRVSATTLLNRAATKQSITEAVEGLKRSVEPQDSVVLFLSSHGFPGEGDQGVYLAPWNLRRSDLPGTGVAWRDLLAALEKVSARSLILIVDHCFSGGVGVELTRRFAADNASLRALRENNILTFTSSASGEVSWEYPGGQHGAFTYALLRALRGQADQAVGADGLILLDLVEPFVRSEVERIVRETYGSSVRQRPSLYALPDADKRIPLARVR